MKKIHDQLIEIFYNTILPYQILFLINIIDQVPIMLCYHFDHLLMLYYKNPQLSQIVLNLNIFLLSRLVWIDYLEKFEMISSLTTLKPGDRIKLNFAASDGMWRRAIQSGIIELIIE